MNANERIPLYILSEVALLPISCCIFVALAEKVATIMPLITINTFYPAFLEHIYSVKLFVILFDNLFLYILFLFICFH